MIWILAIFAAIGGVVVGLLIISLFAPASESAQKDYVVLRGSYSPRLLPIQERVSNAIQYAQRRKKWNLRTLTLHGEHYTELLKSMGSAFNPELRGPYEWVNVRYVGDRRYYL